MSAEVPVKLSTAAKDDLRILGGFRARLLNRAIYDELRTPTPSLTVEPTPDEDLQALEIGDYRVIYRPERVGRDRNPSHVVVRVVNNHRYDELTQKPEDFTVSLVSDQS